MTDNEIIKALECCMDEMGCKKGCPCFDPKAKSSHCTATGDNGLEKLALDLINRQKAEIERLEKGWKADVILTANVKAEAIKEFAEIVKNRKNRLANVIESNSHFERVVDSLVKEMVGDV